MLRWEYRPGSLLYFVWTQNRADYADPGETAPVARHGQPVQRPRRQHLSAQGVVPLEYLDGVGPN
ncbi:MAG: hypothetical protein MZU84_08130 [Sphingobacterium sp.]|nr:hypothetical protein [Sphingobacterium sp.]